MTDSHAQQGRNAPGDRNDAGPGLAAGGAPSARRAIASYVAGLVLSVGLTVVSFALPGTHWVWEPSIPVALAVLAIAQIGVHLVFFLHITTAPDNTNNALALAFGILIVALIVVGSLWIMAHLNRNMLPMDQVLRMHR